MKNNIIEGIIVKDIVQEDGEFHLSISADSKFNGILNAYQLKVLASYLEKKNSDLIL